MSPEYIVGLLCLGQVVLVSRSDTGSWGLNNTPLTKGHDESFVFDVEEPNHKRQEIMQN